MLATWTGAGVTTDAGPAKTVVARIASATNRTSPLTTLTGYEATNRRPPAAAADEVVTDENAPPAPIDVLANDTDPDNDPLNVTAIDTTGTVGSATLAGGTVSYGPAAAFERLPQGEAAVDTFTYTASDPFGASDSATVTVTVTGVNDPPTANPDVASTSAGLPVTFDPRANDTDVDDGTVLAITAAGPLTSGSASFTATSITFDPAGSFDGLGAGQTALVLLPYTVWDGFAAASSSVVVTVTGANDPPVANADSESTTEDTSVLVDVLGNDTDPGGDPLVIGPITQPAAGAVTIESDSVRFSPVGAFDALAAGSSTDVMFSYRASDGTELSDPATVTVTVTGVNDPPVAAGDSAATDKLTPVPVAVLANDSDLDDGAVLTVASATAGAKGTTTVAADGTVTYTPGASVAGLLPGQSTTDTFDYTVSDGTVSDTGTVEVTINGVNTAPVANDDPGGGPALDVGEDATNVVLDVLANDVDAEGGPLSVASVEVGLTQGTVTNRTSDVTFTPLESANALRLGDVENITFTYRASDGGLTSDPATVSVTVVGSNDTPAAQNDRVQTAEGTALAIDVRANDADPDRDDPFIVTLVEQPAKGSTAIDGNGEVVFDPGSAFDALTNDETEDVEFRYRITDAAGASDFGTVIVTVVGVGGNQPPVSNFTYSCVQNICNFDGRTSTDENAATLTYSWNFGQGSDSGPLPIKTYTAAATYTVTLTVRDENGLSGVSAQQVTIGEPSTNVPPVPVINTPACVARTCTISGVGSADPNLGDTFTYLWNFGDGGATSTSSSSSKTFAADGIYTVTLITTDGWGKSASTSRVIAIAEPVTNLAPTPVIGTPLCSVRTCTFSGLGSSDPNGDAFTYLWNFGDVSATSTTSVPVKTYAADGTYTVTLTLTDAWGDFATSTYVLTILEPVTNVAPVPVIDAPSCVGRVCALSSAGSADPDGDALTYLWNFGDGTPTSTLSTPLHTFPTVGSFTVTLTVTDGWGDAASTTRVVTLAEPVTNVAPNPVIDAPVCTARTCLFSAVTSTDPDGDPFTYLWNWGDASATSTAASPTKTFAADNTYVVTLTLTDVWDRAATATRNVTIAEPATNVAPTPVIGGPFCVARECSFFGVNSSDLNGDAFTYSWNFGDGSALDTTASPVKTYAADGIYTVTLTVTDAWGDAAITTVTVTIAKPITNVAPVPVINTPSCASQVCSFSGIGSSDANGDAFTYTWNWGDATATSTDATPAHTFPAAGTFTVTLTVTDVWGDFSSTTRQVIVV